MVLEKLAHMREVIAAKGHTYQIANNPVFNSAVAAHRALLAQHDGPEQEAPQFKEALKPFVGCKVPHDLKKRIQANALQRKLKGTPADDTPIPANYDSRELGLIPAIRNQKNCGSCWNFTGVGMSEVALIVAKKVLTGTVIADKTLDLAEQEVLSCGQNGGCNGDWPETSLKFAQEVGLPFERDVPYQASSGSGVCFSGYKIKIKDCGYVGGTDGVAPTPAIQRAIMKYGIVGCAVSADDYFAAYSSGEFDGSGSDQINHAILLVGWKTINGVVYWILRNHWDQTWGDAGYMLIREGANQVGFGAMWAEAEVEPTPAPGPKPDPVPPTPKVKVINITLTGHVPPFGGQVTFTGTGTTGDAKFSGVLAAVQMTGSPCECEEPKTPEAVRATNLKALQFNYGLIFSIAADVAALIASGEAKNTLEALQVLMSDITSKSYSKFLQDAAADVPTFLALATKIGSIITGLGL